MRKPFILILLIFCFIPASSKIIYVKATATGSNNGSSWLNAFLNLHNALSNSIEGDTIKVAMGTYKPGIASTSDTARYRMRNGVTVLGGYANDTTIVVRNWSLYPTILSGEINNPQFLFDNINTLIQCFNVSAVWDGLILEGSRISSITISGNSQPTFRNFVFRNSYSSNFMGPAGLSVTSQGSSPNFINCIFYNNQGELTKGIIYCTVSGNPVFTNCVFAKNEIRDTASVFNVSGTTLTIKNSTFFGNNTVNTTEGKSVIKGTNSSTVNISNSIFFHNLNWVSFSNEIYSQDSSEIQLINSTANVSNTIIQNFTNGTALIVSQNPIFRDTADIDGPDNMFFTSDDGLQIMNPCSPALNSGNNSAAAGITTDILGNPRIYNSQVVDLGPYEVQAVAGTPLRVVYVKKTASGTNNGSSWTNAFTDLQSALLYCADTIKVAADTYLPSSQLNPYIAFNLANHRLILGGYPNTGNPTDSDRNPQLNATILSGFLSTFKKSFCVVYSKRNDSTAILDGFVIRDGGSQNLQGIFRSGSVFVTSVSSPVFKNNIIKRNQGAPCIFALSGSTPKFFDCKIDSNITGVEARSASPLFKRCTFTGNTGWVTNNYNSTTIVDSCTFIRNVSTIINNYDNSSPTISNSKFINNGNVDTGPDIYNVGSSPFIFKCYFTDSLQSRFGGAIKNESLSAPVFRSCEFNNFRVVNDGGVVHNSNSSPTFISCVFAKNRATFNGGVSYSTNYSSPKFINCVADSNAGAGGSFMMNIRSFAEIINTTITKHFKGGTASATSVIINRDSARLTIKNSILWGNVTSTSNISAPYNNITPDVDDAVGPNFPSVTTMFNSVTQYFGTNGVNGNFVGVNPRMFEYNDGDGLDNTYFTADDGIRLTSCSPVLNAGNNTYIAEATDILSNTRIVGTNVDPGAYEYQDPAGGVSNVSYVNALATGNNTGTSWENAFTNLWSAINNICADTIKVAAGTYKPAISSRDSSFVMVHGKVYWGGYPNTGNPNNAQRDPILHPTILSGNIGNQNDSTDNTRHVVHINNADTSVTLDGFTIMDGQAEFSSHGGGILSIGSRTNIRNCIIKNNHAASGGGIAIILSPRLKISKTYFYNNTAGRGGGLYVETAMEAARAIVENSIFENNRTIVAIGASGGGVYVNSSVYFFASGIEFNNIIMYNNYGSSGGGGMYLSSPYKVGITNCNFLNNIAGPTSRGAGLYNQFNFSQDQGYPKLTNSIFNGNHLGTPGSDLIVGVNIFDSGCQGSECFGQNVNYTSVQFYSLFGGGINNTSLPPQFINANDPDGPDNIWMTNDDGLQQVPCSQLNNIGSNAAVANIPVDILGKPRIFATTVDLGAYESQGALVSVSASDTTICQGAAITFTATPTGGGSSPTYQWQVNGINVGTNSNTFTSSTLNNNDQVKVLMTSNESCLSSAQVTSNIITVHTVLSLTPSVSITASQSTICAGTNITFTSTPVNGGQTPSYQWQVNGTNAGTNSNTFSTSSLTNGSQVKVIMTSAYTCASPAAATSNIISITVSPMVTPAVSVSTSSTSICTGTNVTFTATPTNGGSSPSYQWKRNGTNVGTNSNTYSNNALASGDIISVTLTSNASCITSSTANSNDVTITANNQVTPSISISGNTTVNTGTATLISAAITNGGSTPTYQWQDSTAAHSWQNIIGATNATINYTPLMTGDKLRCILTSNALCVLSTNATSNAISFTVNSVTGISPVQASDYGIICYPNPTTSFLIIDSLKVSDKWESISTTGLDGKQNLISRSINNQTRITLDVSILPGGMYVVIFKGKNNKRIYLKFVKL